MSSLFCCADIRPYRPQEASPGSGEGSKVNLIDHTPPFAVQLVRQANYGPLESKRYFIPVQGKESEFVEVVEDDLVQANFQKLNSYKNYKCGVHTKFFEVNLYQKDPVNKHHWRADLARPASSIDL
ncbi:hypothetical protein G7Z17_g7064 [Cylindrodendrum hubeiense]|uniref:Uncharacterized protein n=1 Tax=Cylindrodendrum hubeiense TaxID=595255 RepID=A0A9P5HB62_9HYPO|nr:hypothetical protein G7Z17_g7064 [Cylindrodendrum hubeiense]